MSEPHFGADDLSGADSVTRNAGFSLASQVVTSVFTGILALFLARTLGAEKFGILALAVGFSELILLLVDLGVSLSTAHFVATHRHDASAVRSLLSDALRLKLSVTVPAVAALVALAGPIARAYGVPALTWPIRGVAIAVLGQSLLLLYMSAFAALGRIRLQLRVQVVESLVETGASILLVLIGGGASGAAWGRGIGYLVGGGFAVGVTVRRLGSGIIPRSLRGSGRTRAIVGYAKPLFIINGAYTLYEQIDIFIIGAARSAVEVGYFQVPLRLCTFLQYPGYSLANALAPRLVGNDSAHNSAEQFGAALRILVLFYAALIPPLTVWAGPIIRLGLGDGYVGAVPALRALAPFFFLSGLSPLVSISVTYLGQARKRVPVALGTVALNGAIDIVLVPRMGIVGAAIGTDVALALYVAAHLQICRRHFGFALKPLALTLLRAALAGAAAAGVLALLGVHHLSWRAWVAGAVAGPLVYVALLLLTAEVQKSEVGALINYGARSTRSNAPK